jgi:membrane protein YdbS with pleckstrin-like domain
MYDRLKGIVLSILKCPKAPPDPPAGSHDSVHVFRAAPTYLTYRLLLLGLGLMLPVIGEIIGIVIICAFLKFWGLLLAPLLVIAIICKAVFLYIVTRLDYEMRYYIVTDRSLRIREGVVQVRESTLTFENIQNLKIVQGPVQRLFGISDLVVETAGGGGRFGQEGAKFSGMMHRCVFRGVDHPAQLRDRIMAYLRTVRSTGLGDHDDADELVYALGWEGRAGAHPASVVFGLGPDEVAALRAIRDEAASLRRALHSP